MANINMNMSSFMQQLAEKTIDKTMKFLYEQGPEFCDVNEELIVLRELHKKVKL